MRTKITGILNGPSASAVAYAPLSASLGAWASTEGPAVAMPTAGSFRKFRVNLAAAPGAGRSRTVTIRKNYVDTGLTVTLSNSETDAVVEGNVSVAQGDLISLSTTPSGSPTAAVVTWCADFQGSSDGVSILCSSSTASASSIIYNPIAGNTPSGGSAPANELLVSAAGTLKNFTVRLNAAVASSRTFTIRKNGVNTAVAVSLGGGSTGGEDNVNSVSVVPGDRIVIVLGGSSQAFTGIYYGLVIEPTTDGNSTTANGSTNPPSATATNYLTLAGGATAWQTTAAAQQGVLNATTLKRLDVRLTSAPGAGNSRTFTVLVNGVATALQVVLSDTSTTGSIEADVSVAAGDMVVMQTVPFSSPASSGRTYYSVGMYELNPSSGRSGNVIFFH